MFLKEFLQKNNIEATEDMIKKFFMYSSFLQEKNKQFNLTAITDPEEIEVKHFADSILGHSFVFGKVLDIGAGAGFPSVPLKIVKPELDITMVDSLNKRVSFLNELINLLDLKNIKAVHSRAEDLPKTVRYDTAVARAVASLSTLSEYTIPFLKVGGRLVAYKSFDCKEEVIRAESAVRELGGVVEKIETFSLGTMDIMRSFVLIKKIKETPQKYPRIGNKPKKNPL